jgi:putative hemolysin
VSDVWLNIVMVVVFVLIGGAFSGAEIALVSLRESQVRAIAEKGRRGQAVQRLLSDPNRFLAAVQVGVTLAGFFSAAFGASTLSAPVAHWLEGRGLSTGLSDTLALVLVTIAISYLSLVVGELTPKRLALQRAEGFALVVATPLNAIAKLVRPLIWLLSKSTDLLVRLLGGDPKVSGEAISQEELRNLVAAHESLTSDERKLIDEVFRAGDREVREVMTPRTEVMFLDASTTASRAARQVADSSWSRFPVAGRDEDDVVGFVHVRDLFLPGHPAGREPRARGEAAARHGRRAHRSQRDAPREPAPGDRRRRVRRHRRHRDPGGPHRGGHRGDLRRVRRRGGPQREGLTRRPA